MPANLVLVRGHINIRSAPTLTASDDQHAEAGDLGVCTNVVPDADGDAHHWLNVSIDNPDHTTRIGYVRDDVVYVVGDFRLYGQGVYTEIVNAYSAFTPLGGTADRAPATPPAASGKWAVPVQPYVVTEPYQGPTGHLGVDLAGAVGTPVLARGKGSVWQANICPHCPGGNGSVPGTLDPLTSYGFGIEVITRHAYNDLPASAQQALNVAGMIGGYLFIIHGHLSALAAIHAGDAITAGTLLGNRGTSGNSTGSHTHVETRATMNAAPQSLWDMSKVALVDPNSVFAL